jgi:hypothetical protein
MSPQLQAMWIRLTADKRKFSVFMTCLAVGLLLWARLIFLRDVPRTAIARDQDSAQLALNLTGGQDEADETRPTVHVPVRTAPTRDPFALHPSHFPEPTETTVPVEVTPKSAEGTTDVQVQDEPKPDIAAEARHTLTVVSLIGGTRPVAMIRVRGEKGSETLVCREGQTVAGFRLMKLDVEHRAVVVRKGGIDVTLNMETNGS